MARREGGVEADPVVRAVPLRALAGQLVDDGVVRFVRHAEGPQVDVDGRLLDLTGVEVGDDEDR